MKRYCLLFFVILLYGCNEPKIQEYELDRLVSSMRSAVEQQDIEMLRGQFASDAVIEINMPAELGGKVRYSVETYLKDVATGWKMGINPTYRVEDLTFRIAEDGQSAVITDVVYEEASHNGKVVMSTKTQETIDVIRIEDEIKVKKVYGDLSVL